VRNWKVNKFMKNAGYNSQVFGKASIAMMLALGAFALLPASPVHAQGVATLPTKEVNITLNQAPVRTALDTLFKSAGLNYTIDPSVTGLVTVSLRAVPFDVALRSILRSSDPPLTFTVDDGVYDITPRNDQNIVVNGGLGETGTGATAPTTTADTGETPDTATQVVPLKLNYANALLLLTYALGSTNPSGSGVIPPLNAPIGGGNRNGNNSGGGMSSGGFGGGGMSSGGFGGGGMSSGGFGGGGMSGGSFGGGGMSGGGFGGGGMSGGGFGGSSGGSVSF
jgi:hypothetical protein